MRLIDADLLIETLKKDGFHVPQHIIDVINEQPTAYDVDVVVWEIDDWNKVTGAIPEGSSWFYELLWIIKNGGVK